MLLRPQAAGRRSLVACLLSLLESSCGRCNDPEVLVVLACLFVWCCAFCVAVPRSVVRTGVPFISSFVAALAAPAALAARCRRFCVHSISSSHRCMASSTSICSPRLCGAAAHEPRARVSTSIVRRLVLFPLDRRGYRAVPAHAGQPLLVVHSSLCLCVCLCCVVLGCGWVGLAGWVLVRVLNVVVGARAQRGGVLNVVAFSTWWQRPDGRHFMRPS